MTARTKACVLRAHTVRHYACRRLLLTMPIRTRADLRCDGGGVSQACHDRDDLRVPRPLGPVQRRVVTLPTGKRGEGAEVEAAAAEGEGGGCGRRAEGRRGAYAVRDYRMQRGVKHGLWSIWCFTEEAN